MFFETFRIIISALSTVYFIWLFFKPTPWSCFEVNTQIIKIIQKNLRFCSISITLYKKTNDENRINYSHSSKVAPPLPTPLHRSHSSIVCLVLMVRLVTAKEYLTYIDTSIETTNSCCCS